MKKLKQQRIQDTDPMFAKLEGHKLQEKQHEELTQLAEAEGEEHRQRFEEEKAEIEHYLGAIGKPSEEEQ